MHEDVQSVVIGGLRDFCKKPSTDGVKLTWTELPEESPDETIVRKASKPFSASGGLRLLQGNLGRSIIKSSAVPEDRYIIEAPAIVFDAQEELLEAFKRGELEKDFVAVVRFQGPKANGMPELHKLTPPLSVLQEKGFKVAIVTDGRMSGASGKVPAAIHLSPEASAGGAIAKIRTGDLIRLNVVAGTLNALVDEDVWKAREVEELDDAKRFSNAHDMGRELFGGMRKNVLSAEEGACTWL